MIAHALKYFTIIGLIAVAQPAAAKDATTVDPEKVAAAKAYLEVTDMKSKVREMIPGVVANLASRLETQGAPVEGIQYFQTRFIERMFFGHWGEFEGAMENLLVTNFNTEELKALATFYSSPIGRSIMGKFSKYTVQTQAFVGKWMQKHMATELQGALEDARKKGYDLKLPTR